MPDFAGADGPRVNEDSDNRFGPDQTNNRGITRRFVRDTHTLIDGDNVGNDQEYYSPTTLVDNVPGGTLSVSGALSGDVTVSTGDPDAAGDPGVPGTIVEGSAWDGTARQDLVTGTPLRITISGVDDNIVPVVKSCSWSLVQAAIGTGANVGRVLIRNGIGIGATRWEIITGLLGIGVGTVVSGSENFTIFGLSSGNPSIVTMEFGPFALSIFSLTINMTGYLVDVTGTPFEL